MSFVADSTPLIALGRIGALQLLRAFADEVLVPSAVAREVYSPRPRAHATRSGRRPPWITVVAPRRTRLAFPPALGAGECEALALAFERKLPLLTDDLAAGQFARTHGVPVTRTLAPLLSAEEHALVEDAEVLVDALVANGFRLSAGVLGLFRAQLVASRSRPRHSGRAA